ncbi:PAS domain-containing protein [Undibacterium arcticum]
MDDNIQVDQLNTGTDPWYQALFECSPQPMYIYDAETLGFLAVNEAASHHYGFSRDEFLLLTTKEIRPPGRHSRSANRNSGTQKGSAGQDFRRAMCGSIV